MRWEHPTRGLVSPDDFIPEAEHTGAIHALGAWVLGQACGYAASRARSTGLARDVAVNVSGRELRSHDYPGNELQGRLERAVSIRTR